MPSGRRVLQMPSIRASATRAVGAVSGPLREQRNEAAMPMYELTCRLAMLEPPSPGIVSLRGLWRQPVSSH